MEFLRCLLRRHFAGKPMTAIYVMIVILRWKTIRYINSKLTKLIDARENIYRESGRLML